MHLNALFKAAAWPRTPIYRITRIMRLTGFILLAACLQVSAAASGQKVTIVKKQISLEEVFNQIRKQAGYNFIYSEKAIRRASPVNLDLKNVGVEAVLRQCFIGQPLTYAIDDKVIVITPKPVPVTISAPGREITGVVTDSSTGRPLAGVTLRVKGEQIGAVTDVGGNFKLEVSDGAILIISYLGYTVREVPVGSAAKLHILLSPNSTGLNQLVVVGYGTQKKADVTAAISTLDGESLSRTTSSTISRALVGKVAGITYRQKSGQPGSAANIQIRNFGTPLYVIDGVIQNDGQFNNLDVNDIKSISIIKDGAAAIYGVKAANGVVLVTTKDGRINMKPTVSVDTYYGWQKWTTYPTLLNAYQWNYANYMKDVNDGTLGISADSARSELEKWKNGQYKGYDWYDNYVSKAAPQSYIHANVSGGGKATSYYFSLSHVDQDAVFKDYNFNRTNMQSNLDVRLSDRVKIGMKINGRIEIRDNPGMPGTDDYEAARAAIFYLPPVYGPYANDNSSYLNAVPDHYGQNLAAMTDATAGNYKQVWHAIQGNWNVEYKTPLKGLTANGLFSYYYDHQNLNNFEKGWREYTFDPADSQYLVSYDKSAAGDTYLNKVRSYDEDLTGQATLNYDNIFGEKHHLSGIAGFEFSQHKWNYLQVQQHPVENEFIPVLSTSKNNAVSDDNITTSTASFVFRANYAYEEKYMLQVAGRYDGSWRFPEGNRWGLFPSVSAAWRLSEEPFYKESSLSSWMSNIKLRFSYGAVGDDNLGGSYPDFAFQSGYLYNQGSALLSTDAGNDSHKVIGSSPKGTPITTLSWMTSTITNLGIDLGLLDDRLTVEVDAFKRVRKGIPAVPDDIEFPTETGLSVLPENLNSDATMGVDGYIRWAGHAGEFHYSVGLNATLARAKNLKRYGEKFFDAWDKYRYSQEDRWANVVHDEIWMYQVIGVFKTQEQIDNYPVIIDGDNNNNLVPGDLIFKDLNHDGVIDQFDERPMGYAGADYPGNTGNGDKNPLFTMGINLGFQWKGVDFSANLAGGFLNTYVADWQVKWGVDRTSNGFVYNSLDVWHHADILDPTSPWVPGAFPALRNGNASTRWWNNFYTKNVNYLRLRDVTVGYTLPQGLTSKVGIQKCRIYYEGMNLMFFFNSLKAYGLDPEISSVNGQDYPQNKVSTIGLNLTF